MKVLKVLEVLKKVVVVVLLCLGFYGACWYQTHYTRDCIVIEVTDDYVMVKDKQHNYWKFVGDGFEIGQVVRLTFYNNHTDTDLIDDEIVDVE